MKKLVLPLAIMLSFLSCKMQEDTNTGSIPKKIEPPKKQQLILEFKQSKGISFDFIGYCWPEDKENICIKSSLYNGNTDTSYLFTYSCFGEVYQIEADSTAIGVSYPVSCNASFPTIIKIAPKSHYTFDAYGHLRKKIAAIQLGFRFYETGRDYTDSVLQNNFEFIGNSRATHKDILSAPEHNIKVITDTVGLNLPYIFYTGHYKL